VKSIASILCLVVLTPLLIAQTFTMRDLPFLDQASSATNTIVALIPPLTDYTGLNGVAFASSNPLFNEAYRAFNPVFEPGGWVSTEPTTITEYVGYQFNSLVTVSGISADTLTVENPTNFTISFQSSLNGSTWNTVISLHSTNGSGFIPLTRTNFPPVTASYFRIIYPQNNTAFAQGVQLYGF
jgi:hypothetical protein